MFHPSPMSLSRARSLFGSPNIPRNPMNFPDPDDVVNDFMDRKDEIEQQNANEFLDLLLFNIESNAFGFNQTETETQQQTNDTPVVNPEDIADGLYVDGNNVTVSNEKGIGGISFMDLVFLLEYGRKDKGIPPKDVFRKTHEQFRKQAVQNILNF